MYAICIYCGERKSKPWGKCPSCKKTPDGEDLVKSVYCSTGRYADEDLPAEFFAELDTISNQIKQGEQVRYSEEKLRELKKQREQIDSTPVSWNLLIIELIRQFFPGFMVIAGLLVLLLLLKWLNS